MAKCIFSKEIPATILVFYCPLTCYTQPILDGKIGWNFKKNYLQVSAKELRFAPYF